MEAQLPATPSVVIIVEVGSAMPIASIDANLQQLVDVDVEWVRKPTCGEADVYKAVLHSFTLKKQPEASSFKPIGFFGLERSLRCIERSLRCILIHSWCR